MITIEDARSGNDVPIDELLEFECHGVFSEIDNMQITLTEETNSKNKERRKFSLHDPGYWYSEIYISKTGKKYYFSHTDSRGNSYRREITQDIVDDYKLKVWIDY